MDIFGIRRLSAYPTFTVNHTDGVTVVAETLVGHRGVAVIALPNHAAADIVKHIQTTFHNALLGCNATDQTAVDDRLAAVQLPGEQAVPRAVTFAISTAIARAGANATGRELAEHLREFAPFAGPGWHVPTPVFDAFGRGEADGLVTFAINPRPARGSRRSISQLLTTGRRLFTVLPRALHSVGHVPVVSSTGDWHTPDIGVRDVLDALVLARHTAGIDEADVRFGLRRQPYVFFAPHVGVLHSTNNEQELLDATALGAAYGELARRYPLGMLEDPFRADSWEQWRSGRQQLPNTHFMADRAVALSDTALVAAATSDALHGVVVNMDLAATLSDAVRFAVRAKGAGLDRLVAAAADSTDAVSVDVAVAIGAEYIRLGTTSRFEHISQYNRLNELSMSLGL